MNVNVLVCQRQPKLAVQFLVHQGKHSFYSLLIDLGVADHLVTITVMQLILITVHGFIASHHRSRLVLTYSWFGSSFKNRYISIVVKEVGFVELGFAKLPEMDTIMKIKRETRSYVFIERIPWQER